MSRLDLDYMQPFGNRMAKKVVCRLCTRLLYNTKNVLIFNRGSVHVDLLDPRRATSLAENHCGSRMPDVSVAETILCLQYRFSEVPEQLILRNLSGLCTVHHSFSFPGRETTAVSFNQLWGEVRFLNGRLHPTRLCRCGLCTATSKP